MNDPTSLSIRSCDSIDAIHQVSGFIEAVCLQPQSAALLGGAKSAKSSLALHNFERTQSQMTDKRQGHALSCEGESLVREAAVGTTFCREEACKAEFSP